MRACVLVLYMKSEVHRVQIQVVDGLLCASIDDYTQCRRRDEKERGQVCPGEKMSMFVDAKFAEIPSVRNQCQRAENLSLGPCFVLVPSREDGPAIRLTLRRKMNDHFSAL